MQTIIIHLNVTIHLKDFNHSLESREHNKLNPFYFLLWWTGCKDIGCLKFSASVMSFWGSFFVRGSSEQSTRINKWISGTCSSTGLSLTAHTLLSLTLLLTVMFQSMDSSRWVSLVSAALPMTTEPIKLSIFLLCSLDSFSSTFFEILDLNLH